MATRKNYTAKIRFEIEPKSLKELEKILDKFKHTWDDKVFKATDQLGGRLDKLTTAVDLNRKSFESIMRNAAAGGQYAQKGAAGGKPFDTDQFFNELEKSMKSFAAVMNDAAQEISKLTINVKGNTSASGAEGEQRRADYAAMELAEGQRKVFMQGERHRFRDMEAAQDHRLKQERLMTRHMMSMFGGGLVGGSIGMMMKELGGGAGKRFTKSTETQEYLKTVEGQDTLAYARSDPNMRQPDFQGISKEWRDKGVSIGSVEEAGSARGRAKSWMGRRIQGAQEGDMSKMFGGKKGMAIAGGAIAGVGIMKKAISLGIESSPMMQQMLKLWKFGIMMIFRPIGDFFGFFLRPIFVYLLRKFIIPFYQTYLPLMQELGQTLGESVVGILESIFGILHILNPLYTEQKDLLKGVTGSVDAINPQLLSDTELITAAIENSKLNTDDLMGDWKRFAEQLFPNQDVKGYDIAGMGDNIPLTQAAVDFYRELGHQVIPSLKDGSGRFDSGVSTFSTATQQFADTVASIQAGEAGNTERVGGEDPRSQKKTIIVIDNSGNSTTTGDGITPEDQDDVDAALEATQYKRGAWS